MHWIRCSRYWGLGSICSFLLKNHGFLQGLGFSFLQKPAFLQVFRVKGAVKPCILQVFRVSALYFCSYFLCSPFFPDFQVPSEKGDSSIRLSYEIGRFPQNPPDPFFEVLFLLKPRRNGFLFYFQGQNVS